MAGGRARDEERAESFEVLADPWLVRNIRDGLADVVRGDLVTLDDLEAELRALGRSS